MRSVPGRRRNFPHVRLLVKLGSRSRPVGRWAPAAVHATRALRALDEAEGLGKPIGRRVPQPPALGRLGLGAPRDVVVPGPVHARDQALHLGLGLAAGAVVLVALAAALHRLLGLLELGDLERRQLLAAEEAR